MVDALDAHYVMGNFSEFKRAVQLVIKNVQFNSDSIIQVFEVSLNALISCYTVMPASAPFCRLLFVLSAASSRRIFCSRIHEHP